MTSYLFDSGSDHELRRLQALSELYDQGTHELLARLAPEPGARCLEVGAGAGSIARWLAEKVGPVIATDMARGVEVRRHDIVKDALEPRSFDLIHARALVMHLPDRERAIDSMLRALRPGGTLLIEDIILADSVTWPEIPSWSAVIAAARAAFRAVGADPLFGIKLPAVLRRDGFSEPGYEVRAPVAFTGTPSDAFYTLCLEQLRPIFVRASLLDEAAIERVLVELRSRGRVTLAPLMAASWVRRLD